MGSSARQRVGRTLVAAGALCIALLASAPAASARLAESLSGGTTTIVLDGRLFRALEAEGVRVEALRPATIEGRTVEMPLGDAYLEYGRGTGYAFEQGGIRLRGPDGSAALRKLVLNTAKGRLNATVAGHQVVLANPSGSTAGRPATGSKSPFGACC